MTERTYNGWSNYETWTVSLWMDNERHSHEYWRRQAAEHRQAVPTRQLVADGVWTAEEAAKFNLADQIKEETADDSPLKTPSLYSDLLNAAFGEVNWQEIAGHLLADVAEQEDPESEVFGAVISSYSRAQAIADGLLVDVSEMAQEAGIKHPMAVTAAVWAQYVTVPDGVDGQDEHGRLWDVLNMFRFAALRSAGQDTLRFEVLVRNDNTTPKRVTLKAICGPGDTPEPVLTILLPDED